MVHQSPVTMLMKCRCTRFHWSCDNIDVQKVATTLLMALGIQMLAQIVQTERCSKQEHCAAAAYWSATVQLQE